MISKQSLRYMHEYRIGEMVQHIVITCGLANLIIAFASLRNGDFRQFCVNSST